ncbi:MAG: ABC transporter ATP-binding protein [Anaerolineae bacterium]
MTSRGAERTALCCRHLGKVYPTGGGHITALADVSFSLGEGELLCLVGPSGCGKTTLLKLIAGLAAPTEGHLIFGDTPPGLGPRAALVFQEHGLFPWLSVLDNVAFGLEARGMARTERRRLARAFIERMGLRDFAESYPHQLSTGMRQRVGIARAFVTDAPILLMDEPFGSLDAQTRSVLRDELLSIWQTQNRSVVFVTHDIEEAVLLGDRVLVMTGRPGCIRDEIPVPLDRPRGLSEWERAQVADITWHIWKMLEPQVRHSLRVTG